jgi:hypothetical protein
MTDEGNSEFLCNSLVSYLFILLIRRRMLTL